MKIFGITFTTKKFLNQRIAALEAENNILYEELDGIAKDFPFDLGQVVYDVALKNAQGRYTKTKPSREHCTITEVEVNEKNYFSLKKRLENNDVFYDRAEADEYLESVCENV